MPLQPTHFVEIVLFFPNSIIKSVSNAIENHLLWPELYHRSPEIIRLHQLVPWMREVETTVHPQLETLAPDAFSASFGFLGTSLQSEDHFGWERVGMKNLGDFKSPSSNLPPLYKSRVFLPSPGARPDKQTMISVT